MRLPVAFSWCLCFKLSVQKPSRIHRLYLRALSLQVPREFIGLVLETTCHSVCCSICVAAGTRPVTGNDMPTAFLPFHQLPRHSMSRMFSGICCVVCRRVFC
ncbi:hypothetical protein CC86DRAFT_115546 [Ophiobolus disseminans]|uniref:Uncharacterized protein n=1 Tax=Ophiobolus disseminans TaxID=1469910 RepID=A0A6A6ZHV5_9PLEO|nr:hypothetical protein CC86DRAFT_115546 [Ophiobolus disseminans]